MAFAFRILLILASIPGVVVHELGHQILCHLAPEQLAAMEPVIAIDPLPQAAE